jgi:hypothetical protein
VDLFKVLRRKEFNCLNFIAACFCLVIMAMFAIHNQPLVLLASFSFISADLVCSKMSLRQADEIQ